MWGPHVCGEAIDFRNDGYTMVTGSYRSENALEVWDLRMFKRSHVIDWDGQGTQQLFMDIDDTESEVPTQTEDEEESKEEQIDSQSQSSRDPGSMSETTATRKKGPQ